MTAMIFAQAHAKNHNSARNESLNLTDRFVMTGAPVRAFTLPMKQHTQASLRHSSHAASRKTVAGPPTSTDDVPAPLDGCQEIDVGNTYGAPTAPTGTLRCFQFITEPSNKITVYVADLPAGEQHDVHLFEVANDGTWNPLDSVLGIDSFKVTQAIRAKPTGILLLIDAQQAVGGATFQFQATTTSKFDGWEANDSLTRATHLTGNIYLRAYLDNANDFDYYSIAPPATQSSTSLTFTGSSRQVIERQGEDGTWISLANNRKYQIRVPAGDTIHIRVYSPLGDALPEDQYWIKTSDPLNRAGIDQYSSNENLSGLAPGLPRVAREIDVGVTVWDEAGNVPQGAGEHVTIEVYDSDGRKGTPTLLAQTDGLTNAQGSFAAKLDIGPCRGPGIEGPHRFNTYSVPAEYWDITYVPKAFVVAYTDNNRRIEWPGIVFFTHVCDERYRGYRP
ncbi:hypothetical protein [Luteibacter rhizovicinus]|nr:hypothetical protein [Luteibacter rhizovicinus]